ncbi:hypothetical protein IBX73_08445 [candidate division WOR-3 bacterium]|nr:hypothetical protein [candidate division WOR-3 bacterium]
MKAWVVYLVLIVATVVSAQEPDTLWTKTLGGIYNDYGRCVIQSADGGYVMTGWTTSWGAGNTDVCIIKTDSLGNTLWIKFYGGTGWDYGNSIVQTSDFGYVIAGFTNSFGVAGTNIYLLKTDSLGDTLWTKTYGGIDNCYGYAVVATPDGGYLITGSRYGTSLDVLLVRTDSLGTVLWTKTYGGPELDEARSIALTADGGCIVAATTSSFGSGLYDVYVLKCDSLGDTLWTRTYGGIYDDCGYSVIALPNGDFIIAGETSSFLGPGYEDVYLIRIKGDGDTLWTKTYGGTESDMSYSAVLSSDMGCVITGQTYSLGAGYGDVYVVKTDSLGNLLWTKTYGGSDHDYGYSIAKTTDGGYIIVGSTTSFGAGCNDIWLLKMGPDVGVVEYESSTVHKTGITATIFGGPLQLRGNKKCKVLDITGRVVEPENTRTGVYFIEVDGVVIQKVVKVK